MESHIKPELVKALREIGFTELTEIQQKAIPLIKAGSDVIGQSMTGSGKTAAFSLPIIEKIEHRAGLQALVLVPTRELCEQVANEMFKFSKYKRTSIVTVYGGVSIMPQISGLRHADLVVATPGRMLDHISRGTINLSKVKTLVLDEADKMFEMGFIDDVKEIISRLPRQRQTLLFSATMSTQVMDIVRHYMNEPKKIKVQSYVEETKLDQSYYQVNSKDKFSLLLHLLKQGTGITIIFCATRRRVDIVSRNLEANGVRAISLHGGLTQSKRKYSMDLFHQKKANVLVASDVAARGIDVKDVNHVINYDIPKNSKEYVHRIGRTARAGSEGKVISLLSQEDHENFRAVLGDRSLVINELKVPEFERISFSAAHHEPRGFGERRGFGPRGPRRSFGRGPRGSGHSHRREDGDRPRYGHSRDSQEGSSHGYRGNRSSGGYSHRSSEGHSSSGEGSSHGHGGHGNRSHGSRSSGPHHRRFR
jgi:superfamily II DNA/RNA helicase